MRLENKIIEMYVRGERVKTIASELDVSTWYVENLVYRELKDEDLITKRKIFKMEKIKKIKEKKESGVKISELAKELGVTKTSLHRALRAERKRDMSTAN